MAVCPSRAMINVPPLMGGGGGDATTVAPKSTRGGGGGKSASRGMAASSSGRWNVVSSPPSAIDASGSMPFGDEQPIATIATSVGMRMHHMLRFPIMQRDQR